MKLSKSVAELQREHIVMELECIDRMYLNAYVPQLTTEAGVAGFVRGYLGASLRFDQTARRDHRMLCGIDHAICARLQDRSGSLPKGSAQGRCHAETAARFQKEAPRRGRLYRRGPGKGARAPHGAQGLRQWRHHSLDQLHQRQCELLLFLLSG